MAAVSRRLNFDRLARPYRWLEYLTFGPALERCRFHFLPNLTRARHALMLGDGDGRFLRRLLEANPQLHADVADISPTMLALLNERLDPGMRRRVTLHQADLRSWEPPGRGYDLVVTHFFLDCLFEEELAALIESIQPKLVSGALWVVSEFARPRGGVRARLSGAVISMLYGMFGLLTGLTVRSLPDHSAALKQAGFQCRMERQWLGGLLVSQYWEQSISADHATL
ncbi:trans-aconitate 2-methyltransferase [Acidobacterium sp. S8]|uniref:class I SAM-dependent methyltransferase n=1 Tax=Acidobacterium sp. S8 TaxID=1641854 RepID=UPI00131C3956|nr:class I SAM-dependent methyltransferase [Acidobacterium sp. S8]